jgi:hypothetical protein
MAAKSWELNTRPRYLPNYFSLLVPKDSRLAAGLDACEGRVERREQRSVFVRAHSPRVEEERVVLDAGDDGRIGGAETAGKRGDESAFAGDGDDPRWQALVRQAAAADH